MTAKSLEGKDRARAIRKRGIYSFAISTGLLICALLISLFLSDEISHAVKSSLSLCASVIIPSVFPFMIISDLLRSYVNFDSLGIISLWFEKIFKVNRNGISAFLMGVICGFPLGVKCASELYLSGRISRADAEKLIGFSNNTGPAFIVSGIGLGLHGSAADGIVLYAVMVASAVSVGMIFPKGAEYAPYDIKTDCEAPHFDLIDSIKGAAVNTLHICAFLTFFAPICTFLRKILSESCIYLCIIPFLEVGSATSILSKTALLSHAESLALTAFAICFSGFSVHLQALSFLKNTDIRTGKYFLMKLTQGLIAALSVYLIYSI